MKDGVDVEVLENCSNVDGSARRGGGLRAYLVQKLERYVEL